MLISSSSTRIVACYRRTTQNQNGVCRPSESLAWVHKTVRAAFASTRDSSQGLETSLRRVNMKISWISRTVTRPYCINRCNLQSRICRSWIAQWCVANCLPLFTCGSTVRSAVLWVYRVIPACLYRVDQITLLGYCDCLNSLNVRQSHVKV